MRQTTLSYPELLSSKCINCALLVSCFSSVIGSSSRKPCDDDNNGFTLGLAYGLALGTPVDLGWGSGVGGNSCGVFGDGVRVLEKQRSYYIKQQRLFTFFITYIEDMSW